jgi:hypothetical protein
VKYNTEIIVTGDGGNITLDDCHQTDDDAHTLATKSYADVLGAQIYAYGANS